MWILAIASLVALTTNTNAKRNECQAEKLLGKIKDKYDKGRDTGLPCARINYQHHNLCSLLLATTFTQRLIL